jgi:hypothetical protein
LNEPPFSSELLTIAPSCLSSIGRGVRTVHRWLANGSIPQGRHRRKKRSSFDPYAPYVLSRWKDGYRNGQRLYEEIKSQGYQGSTRQLYPFLKALRTEQIALESVVSPNAAKRLLIRQRIAGDVSY